MIFLRNMIPYLNGTLRYLLPFFSLADLTPIHTNQKDWLSENEVVKRTATLKGILAERLHNAETRKFVDLAKDVDTVIENNYNAELENMRSKLEDYQIASGEKW
mgnify:FL=1